jgi:ubiquinone/menaquinone biosynthesis C-methylase UbiE
MNHDDHVRLIAGAFETRGGVWADFGAGWGAFTLAIRDLAGPESEIYALDRDRSALASLREGMIRMFPETYLHVLEGDIRQPPELPPLDGIVAANSLHYVDRKQQAPILRHWSTLLKPGGRIVLVEYDSNSPNQWVPYPISFERLGRLTRDAGLPPPSLLATHPSRWSGDIYSAMIEGPAERPNPPLSF